LKADDEVVIWGCRRRREGGLVVEERFGHVLKGAFTAAHLWFAMEDCGHRLMKSETYSRVEIRKEEKTMNKP
jgi:hypothetical protein